MEKTVKSNSIVLALVNPFHAVGGAMALAIGLAAVVVTGLVGWLSDSTCDGVLDFHTLAGLPFWYPVRDGLIAWLSISVVLFLLGKTVTKTRFRAVDVFGGQALARWPMVIAALAALLPGYQEQAKNLVLSGSLDLGSWQVIVFLAVVLVVLSAIIYMVYLMFRGFAVACNVKGGKAVAAFIAALLAAEIISKMLIGFAGTAPIPDLFGVASDPSALAQAEQKRDSAIRMMEDFSQGRYAEFRSNFDSRMKHAVPDDGKIQEMWQDLETEAGPFDRITGSRLVKRGPLTIVYVRCQCERKDVDVKFVLDESEAVAGLWLEESNSAAQYAPATR